MDIIGGLNNLRKFSYDTTTQSDSVAPGHGKPDDYGLRGSKPNYPLNSVGGRRMAGQGIAGAIAGELAPHLVEPARTVLQPAFNFLVSETFGVQPNIASK